MDVFEAYVDRLLQDYHGSREISAVWDAGNGSAGPAMEALARTLATGEVWYWSRSRRELWRKGATSGQTQSVAEMRVDCDQDAVWLRVRVGGDGGSCHTGRRSCFYRTIPLGQGTEHGPATLATIG